MATKHIHFECDRGVQSHYISKYYFENISNIYARDKDRRVRLLNVFYSFIATLAGVHYIDLHHMFFSVECILSRKGSSRFSVVIVKKLDILLFCDVRQQLGIYLYVQLRYSSKNNILSVKQILTVVNSSKVKIYLPEFKRSKDF